MSAMSERTDCVFLSSLGKGDNLHQQGLNILNVLRLDSLLKGLHFFTRIECILLRNDCQIDINESLSQFYQRSRCVR